MIVVARPLLEHVNELVGREVVTSDFVHAFLHVAAADCADSSPVVVVRLHDVPLGSAEKFNVGGSDTVTRDDGTFIGVIAREGVVRRSDLRLSCKFVECATVG